MSEETTPAVDNDLEDAIDAATDSVKVQNAELQELSGDGASGDNMDLSTLLDVPVEVTVEVGHTRMSLGELVKLGPGSLVELDREAHEAADILVNGKIVARG